VNIEIWEKKAHSLQAVQVTEMDMEEIAAWCDGKIYIRKDEGEEPQFYIQFTAIHHKQKQTMKAFVGDWITWSKTSQSFHHYRDTTFRRGYHPGHELFEKIYQSVSDVIEKLDEISSTRQDPAEIATHAIMKLIEGE